MKSPNVTVIPQATRKGQEKEMETGVVLIKMPIAEVQ